MRNKYGTLPSSFPSVGWLTRSEAPVQHTCKHLAEAYMAIWHSHIHRCILTPDHEINFWVQWQLWLSMTRVA